MPNSIRNKIQKLDSICIWSENPQELSKFYKDILELEVDSILNLPKDTGIQFKIGETFLFIGYHDQIKGNSHDPNRIMIGFTVDSVNSISQHLKSLGVEFILEPSISPDGTFYVSTVKDPEGNIIQFFSDKP